MVSTETQHVHMYVVHKIFTRRKKLAVLHTCTLLRLDQSGSSIDADNEAAGHLGIQCSTVPSLRHAQDSLDPGNHLQRIP